MYLIWVQTGSLQARIYTWVSLQRLFESHFRDGHFAEVVLLVVAQAYRPVPTSHTCSDISPLCAEVAYGCLYCYDILQRYSEAGSS